MQYAVHYNLILNWPAKKSIYIFDIIIRKKLRKIRTQKLEFTKLQDSIVQITRSQRSLCQRRLVTGAWPKEP